MLWLRCSRRWLHSAAAASETDAPPPAPLCPWSARLCRCLCRFNFIVCSLSVKSLPPCLCCCCCKCFKAAHALDHISATSFTSFETCTPACRQLASARFERDKLVACACALLRTCLVTVFANYEVEMKSGRQRDAHHRRTRPPRDACAAAVLMMARFWAVCCVCG